MGYSIDATTSTFQDAVLEASHQQPILVDFFAQWCGPCQLLKPTLERVTQEYSVGLAKVDIDQSPELANAFGVEGVPDVRIAVAGQLQPGFVGVIAEPQLRSLLENLGGASAVEAGLQEVEAAIGAGETERASDRLDDLLTQHPGDERVVAAAIPFWIAQRQLHRAQSAFEAALEVVSNPNSAFLRTLRGTLHLAYLCQTDASGARGSDPETEELKQLACKASQGHDLESALAGFLAILEGDRHHQDQARKAMIAVFDCLGDEHSLTKAYRKKMMMALF